MSEVQACGGQNIRPLSWKGRIPLEEMPRFPRPFVAPWRLAGCRPSASCSLHTPVYSLHVPSLSCVVPAPGTTLNTSSGSAHGAQLSNNHREREMHARTCSCVRAVRACILRVCEDAWIAACYARPMRLDHLKQSKEPSQFGDDSM